MSSRRIRQLRDRRRTWLAAAAAVLSLPGQAGAAVSIEPSVTLTRESIDLEAEGFASYEYELTAGSELVFRVDLFRWQSEPLRIWFLDEPNFRRLTAGEPFDYIDQGTGMVERAGEITVPVAHSHRYFMVLDNSQSGDGKDLAIYAYARTPESTAAEARMQRLYENYYESLDAVVDMEGIRIDVRRCGQPNAFTAGPQIVICRELHDMLAAQGASGLLQFVVLHEAAHSLIDRWGRGWINSNQIMVDRLAATLFRMIGGGELAARTSEWLVEHATAPAELYARGGPALTGPRARRIAAWLDADAGFQRGWTRRIVLPRMRTSALESLLERDALSERTRDHALRELERRSSADDSAGR